FTSDFLTSKLGLVHYPWASVPVGTSTQAGGLPHPNLEALPNFREIHLAILCQLVAKRPPDPILDAGVSNHRRAFPRVSEPQASLCKEQDFRRLGFQKT